MDDKPVKFDIDLVFGQTSRDEEQGEGKNDDDDDDCDRNDGEAEEKEVKHQVEVSKTLDCRHCEQKYLSLESLRWHVWYVHGRGRKLPQMR